MKYWIGLSLLLAGNVAYAESIPIPANSTPGAIIQYNTQPWARPESQTPSGAQPANQAPERTLPVQPDPVDFESPLAQEGVNSPVQLQIDQIELVGNTLLPKAKIEAVIEPYRHQALSFAKMQSLANALTQLYIEAGYINSQVYIPPQQFEEHTLILKVLEVKVDEVTLEGAHWFKARAILPRLGLTSGDNLNIRLLSRRMRLLNENPDFSGKALLKPGQTSGTTQVILDIKDRFPIHLTPYWDNLGRKSIGVQRFGLTSNNNNLLGFGDTLSNSINFSRRSFGVVNQYALPLGPYGTQLGFDYAYSHLNLGGALEPLNLKSTAQIYSPNIRQALWRTDRVALNSSLAFDFKNLNTDILNNPLHRDRLRVLHPGIDGYLNDRWGRTYFNQEVGIGLNILGGSVGNTALASKAGSGTKFFRMSGGITRIVKLPLGTTGVLRSRYQYSPNRLVSAEQFQIGGAYSVRGYQEGRQIGDSGYALSAEWYVPAYIIPARWQLPLQTQPLRNLIQVVGFSDFGQSYTNRAVSGEVRKASLLGCGVGLRLQLTRYLIGRVDVGFPLIHQAGDPHGPRLHFGLQSNWF